MLTAIIPIDLKRRPKDILNKAISLAKKAYKENVKIIFGHNNRGNKYDKIFLNTLLKIPIVKIKSLEGCSEDINTSLLRNLAFSEVDSEYIILLDVDIHPDFQLFKKYLKKTLDNIKPFYILPCLYLTKFGSKLIIEKRVTTLQLKEKFFSFSRKEFLHLASPSSITIMRTNDYKVIGGFDTDYNGHGYEDFDFLVRLCELYKRFDKKTDFLIDKSARSPLFAVGFRKYIGEYCLEVLAEKDFAFHLYHEKDNNEKYYLARKSNYLLFSKKHQSSKINIEEKDTTLITHFVSHCMINNLSIHDYSILFENKPGHIDRYDTFKRKMRFLLK